MPVEVQEVDGYICVVVPEGTRLYSGRALVRDRDFFADVLISFKQNGPESLGEVAKKHGRNLVSTEEVLNRLIHTFNNHPQGWPFVLDSLGLTLKASVET